MSSKTIVRIQETERAERRATLKSRMQKQGVDAVLITPGTNMRYFFDLKWGETERLVAAFITQKIHHFCMP